MSLGTGNVRSHVAVRSVVHRILVALLLAATLSGCSLAAAALGSSRRTVRAARKLDSAVLAPIVAGIASGIAGSHTVGADDGPRPDRDTYLCWLNADGGEEVWAPSAEEARASCEQMHGERDDERHCRCEPVLAMIASGR